MVSGCKNLDPVFEDNNGKEQPQEILTRSGILAWDYPVKPGMESWNRLETEEERIAVLQVPESVLATLSPEEAVGLCITFPSFGHFTAWDTPQKGFAVMLSRYNILRHLLSRQDAGGSLIAAYKDADLFGFRTLPYSNEFWSLKLYYLELLLSQREILQFMTLEEKLELIKEAKLKFFEKLSNVSFAGFPDILFSLRIMANILHVESIGFADETAIRFIETGWFFDSVPPIEEIINLTDNYINAKNEIL